MHFFLNSNSVSDFIKFTYINCFVYFFYRFIHSYIRCYNVYEEFCLYLSCQILDDLATRALAGSAKRRQMLWWTGQAKMDEVYKRTGPKKEIMRCILTEINRNALGYSSLNRNSKINEWATVSKMFSIFRPVRDFHSWDFFVTSVIDFEYLCLNLM